LSLKLRVADQRIFDTKYWEKELDDKLEGIKNENEYLNAYKTRFEKAIDACKEPLHIAQQCLVNRQRRKGIDLVHDDAERELIKEVEVIQGVLALLERTWEQAKEQMRYVSKNQH
jgi:tektin-1